MTGYNVYSYRIARRAEEIPCPECGDDGAAVGDTAYAIGTPNPMVEGWDAHESGFCSYACAQRYILSMESKGYSQA